MKNKAVSLLEKARSDTRSNNAIPSDEEIELFIALVKSEVGLTSAGKAVNLPAPATYIRCLQVLQHAVRTGKIKVTLSK